MTQNTNLAYDLQRFEEQTPKTSPKLTVRTAQRTVHPVKIVMVAALALLMGFTLLYSQVVITELNGQIAAKQEELNTLQAENVRMQTELEGKMSLTEIEEKAVGEYGMVKPDNSQVSYVKLEQENKLEATKPEENIFEQIVRYIQDLF
ncbi:MAG TPA: septum formation initiator family protein [Candidatus Merdivicinus excrementipullorum]|uniref:Septum formation initiator family protein n=1 Tax=Candidatus Merdivicinus excrementipullorum TaxID=2840867 RepID=A0A9D1K115_9FIRM|nr:septum formation initiator family protein [Candidatus Merdivicinus excrementipullorum]